MKFVSGAGLILFLCAAVPCRADAPQSVPAVPQETTTPEAPTETPGVRRPPAQTLTPFEKNLADRIKRLPLQTDVRPLVARNKALPVRWTRFPGAEALHRYIPKAAYKAGIRGQVLAECDWDAHGVVTQCRILEETPQGYGYGEATRQLLMHEGQLGMKREGEAMQAGEGLPVILRWEWY